MESLTPADRRHPLVAGAAISVMLVGLTGAAAMTGMFLNPHGSSASAFGTTVSSFIGAAAAATSPALLLGQEPDRDPTNGILPRADPRPEAEGSHSSSAPQTRMQGKEDHPPSAVAQPAAAA